MQKQVLKSITNAAREKTRGTFTFDPRMKPAMLHTDV